MARYEVNPDRCDPYKNFKFLVQAVAPGEQPRLVAAVSKVSALKRTTEVVEHRSGGQLSYTCKSPGQTKFEPIALERGVTPDQEFEAWARKVWFYGARAGQGAELSLADFRKNLIIQMMNEAGQVAMAYIVYRAWPSEFTALPELDASAN